MGTVAQKRLRTRSLGVRLSKDTRWQRDIAGWLFLLPAVILFFLFAWHPIVQGVIYSFQNVKLQGETTWIGLRNYERMLADPVFGQTWLNAIQFTLISITIGFLSPIIVAVCVNEMRVAKGFFRLVYFLPSVIPGVVSLLIWREIYSANNGILNEALKLLGAPPQLWLQNPALVKFSLVIIMTWGGFGGSVLVYLAALQDIPAELYEASEIDGADPFARLWYMTLPHLRPLMTVLLILQILGMMQVFMEPYILTNGGPVNSTMTPVLAIYTRAFTNADYGLASAWSVTLMLVLLVISIVYFAVNRANERKRS